MSENEKCTEIIKNLYYGEAINYVIEKGRELIEPVPENARPIDRINSWGIEMLAFGLMKGIEMGIELTKEESAA